MKRQIRRGTFETNSSSTHAIVMCMESDYDKWENEGLMLYMGWGYGYAENNKPEENHFYTREEAISFEKTSKYNDNVDWDNEQKVNEILTDKGFLTYDYFWNEYCEDYEDYEETMTTPNGENVVAFGYYGFD